jgi:cytochrome P450
LINVDGPAHARIRRLVQQAFTPASIQRLQSRVRDVVRQLLVRGAGKAGIDVVWEFAYPLPITVITGLMGVPEEERDAMKEWSGQTIEFMATPRPSEAVLLSSNAALVRLRERFGLLAGERRRQPRDDLVTALVRLCRRGTPGTDSRKRR